MTMRHNKNMDEKNFSNLSLSYKEKYSDLFQSAQERASDYSFTNIWAWHCERGYKIAFADGLCWLRLTNPSVFWAPIGNWERDWSATLENNFPDGAVFERVPKTLAELLREQLGDRIEIEEQRSEWEYLYSAQELIDLKGNRFHKKKNLLSQFLKYSPEYEPITKENMPEVFEFQSEWCRLKQCDEVSGLIAEHEAIGRILSDWDKMPNVKGGLLRVHGEFAAYTVGEIIGNMMVVHFEKGLDKYKGVYQGINQMFLSNSNGFEIVNREQDMGFEGLRQAKMTYHPIGFIEKYRVIWKG